MSHKLKNRQAAAKTEQGIPETAAVMHVATNDAPAEQPAHQDDAPEVEAEQPSPLTVAPEQPATQEAAPVATQPAPAFTPLLVPQVPRPLDEILQIVGKAKSLTDRLTGLKATSEKLGSFEIGSEGFTDRLTLRDGNGQEWNTTQSVVIQKVLDVLRGELRGSINATEAELRELLPAA